MNASPLSAALSFDPVDLGDEQNPVPQMGGLGSLQDDDESLMEIENAINRDVFANTMRVADVDKFASSYRGAPPDFSELKRLADQTYRAKIDAAERIAASDTGSGVPWLRLGAGLLKPTRTGSFGESMGSGIEGLAGGLQELAERRRRNLSDSERIRAEAEAGRFGDTSKIVALDTNAKRAEQLQNRVLDSQMLTPAIREWMVTNGVTPEMVRSGQITAEQRADLLRFVNMARGTNQMKNAQTMLSPSDPNFPALVAQLADGPLRARLMETARKMVPEEAYQGRSLGEYQKAVEAKFYELSLGLLNRTLPQNVVDVLTPRGGAAPSATQTSALSPPQGAPAVTLAPEVAQPENALPAPKSQASGAPKEASVFSDYLNAPAFGGKQKPGTIIDKTAEDIYKNRVTTAEARGSDWVKKQVWDNPDALKNLDYSINTAREALDSVGPGAEFLGKAGALLEAFGLASDKVKHFTADVQKFKSAEMVNLLATQLEQRGVQTESDAKRMLEAGLRTANTKEANELILRYMQAGADRLRLQSKFVADYRAKNNGSVAGVDDQWMAFNASKPIVAARNGKVVFSTLGRMQ